MMTRNEARGGFDSGNTFTCTECKRPCLVMVSLTAADPGCAAELCVDCLRAALALAEQTEPAFGPACGATIEIRGECGATIEIRGECGATIEIRGECVMSEMSNHICSRGSPGCNVEHES